MLQANQQQCQQELVCAQIHRTALGKGTAWGKDMYENANIQAGEVDFSRRREQDHPISRTFVILNVLNYKKAQ